jgi:hypothetical protein
MGTLCKNCPLKNIHKETGEDCTVVFVQRYKNSCVTYDLAEHQFKKELDKMSDKKKEELNQLAKDMAEYQMQLELEKNGKRSNNKKGSTSTRNPKGSGKNSKKDSIRVQEVCETT